MTATLQGRMALINPSSFAFTTLIRVSCLLCSVGRTSSYPLWGHYGRDATDDRVMPDRVKALPQTCSGSARLTEPASDRTWSGTTWLLGVSSRSLPRVSTACATC